MASQLLGVTGTDNQGLSGLEYSLDKYLHGRDGERKLTKDALGDAIQLRETKPTVPGTDVRLTLDAAIQDRAEEVLAEVGEELQAQGRDRDRHGPARRRRSSRSPTGRR